MRAPPRIATRRRAGLMVKSMIPNQSTAPMACDLLIRNGTVIDGTGAPAFHADLAISEGKIVQVEARISAKAKKTIDANGLVVAPCSTDPQLHYDSLFC